VTALLTILALAVTTLARFLLSTRARLADTRLTADRYQAMYREAQQVRRDLAGIVIAAKQDAAALHAELVQERGRRVKAHRRAAALSRVLAASQAEVERLGHMLEHNTGVLHEIAAEHGVTLVAVGGLGEADGVNAPGGDS
jgi:hypothetical protein